MVSAQKPGSAPGLEPFVQLPRHSSTLLHEDSVGTCRQFVQGNKLHNIVIKCFLRLYFGLYFLLIGPLPPAPDSQSRQNDRWDEVHDNPRGDDLGGFLRHPIKETHREHCLCPPRSVNVNLKVMGCAFGFVRLRKFREERSFLEGRCSSSGYCLFWSHELL